MQTTMKKNNLNPAWKESFDIDWHGEEIIQIECWDHNKVSNLRHLSILRQQHSFVKNDDFYFAEILRGKMK